MNILIEDFNLKTCGRIPLMTYRCPTSLLHFHQSCRIFSHIIPMEAEFIGMDCLTSAGCHSTINDDA